MGGARACARAGRKDYTFASSEESSGGGNCFRASDPFDLGVTMSKTHVSKVASARFEAAVMASLRRLVESRKSFSVSDVIACARYEDGARVGATTLYAKTSKGTAVHSALLAKLKAAAVASKSRRSSVEFESPPASMLNAKLGVFKQLVEQEARLQQAEAASTGLRHQLGEAQERQYVALACLNILSKGAVLDVVRPLKELEGLFNDEDLVDQLKEEAQALAMTCGRLARTK